MAKIIGQVFAGAVGRRGGFVGRRKIMSRTPTDFGLGAEVCNGFTMWRQIETPKDVKKPSEGS